MKLTTLRTPVIAHIVSLLLAVSLAANAQKPRASTPSDAETCLGIASSTAKHRTFDRDYWLVRYYEDCLTSLGWVRELRAFPK